MTLSCGVVYINVPHLRYILLVARAGILMAHLASACRHAVRAARHACGARVGDSGETRWRRRSAWRRDAAALRRYQWHGWR